VGRPARRGVHPPRSMLIELLDLMYWVATAAVAGLAVQLKRD
jgi:hypothetical protein